MSDQQDKENDSNVSESQISRFADFLKGGKKKVREETKGPVARQKSLEDMSVLSLMTMPGKKWSKSKSSSPQNDFHVKAESWSRPQKPTSTNGTNLGVLFAVVGLIAIVSVAGYIFLNSSADTVSADSLEEETSLEDLLRQ